MSNEPHDDTNANPNDSIDAVQTHAYVAVGALADAIGPDTYHGQDVADARDRLRQARAAAPDRYEGTARVAAAIDALEEIDAHPLEDRHQQVRTALAELAPVAAGVAEDPRATPEARPSRDVGGREDGTHQDVDEEAPPYVGPPHPDDRPAVPVFYPVPEAVADRAITRFNSAVDAADAGDFSERFADATRTLEEYIYDEIDPVPVIYVGGEALGDYAADRVDALEVDPTTDGKSDVGADD